MGTTTVHFCGMEMDVEFDYTPPCKGSRDSYGVPLEPDEEAELEITKIEHKGEDVTELMDYADVSDAIWVEVFKQITDPDL